MLGSQIKINLAEKGFARLVTCRSNYNFSSKTIYNKHRMHWSQLIKRTVETCTNFTSIKKTTISQNRCNSFVLIWPHDINQIKNYRHTHIFEAFEIADIFMIFFFCLFSQWFTYVSSCHPNYFQF